MVCSMSMAGWVIGSWERGGVAGWVDGCACGDRCGLRQRGWLGWPAGVSSPVSRSGVRGGCFVVRSASCIVRVTGAVLAGLVRWLRM
jgi:hypothetical protein